MEVSKPVKMQSCSTGVFRHTNRQHFAQSALVGSAKAGVWFDPVDGDNEISPISDFVTIDGSVVFQRAYLNHIHRRFNRHPVCCFGVTIFSQNTFLTLSTSAAVAPHCRENERLGANRFQFAEKCVDHSCLWFNAPTTNANRNGFSF